ncbi:hypothetical protein [Pilimelia columellifera]|uniref:Uncharacterized protein n=1 Tax=Pilimelia columellifera subsp. columellifera TaxID=706583 RepID=A0ABN3NLE4_9ACTN
MPQYSDYRVRFRIYGENDNFVEQYAYGKTTAAAADPVAAVAGKDTVVNDTLLSDLRPIAGQNRQEHVAAGHVAPDGLRS